MDELDKKIIKLLQENGRLKFSEIARMLRCPRTTIVQRVQRLESEGVIRGYRVIVDPWKIGYRYLAYIMLRVRKGLYARLDQGQIIGKILQDTVSRKDLPFVEEASIITGAYDIILKVWIRDWSELTRFLLSYLPRIEEIAATETFMVLQRMPAKPLPMPIKILGDGENDGSGRHR